MQNTQEFVQMCEAFNIVGGNHKLLTKQHLQKQYDLIVEEVREIKEDGLDQNNIEKILDGCIDTLVTTYGLLQKLEEMGVDVSRAAIDTADNNLSKFIPGSRGDLLDLNIEFYAKQGITVTSQYNPEFDLFVLKDENGKIRKPMDFVANSLAHCIPKGLEIK